MCERGRGSRESRWGCAGARASAPRLTGAPQGPNGPRGHLKAHLHSGPPGMVQGLSANSPLNPSPHLRELLSQSHSPQEVADPAPPNPLRSEKVPSIPTNSGQSCTPAPLLFSMPSTPGSAETGDLDAAPPRGKPGPGSHPTCVQRSGCISAFRPRSPGSRVPYASASLPSR